MNESKDLPDQRAIVTRPGDVDFSELGRAADPTDLRGKKVYRLIELADFCPVCGKDDQVERHPDDYVVSEATQEHLAVGICRRCMCAFSSKNRDGQRFAMKYGDASKSRSISVPGAPVRPLVPDANEIREILSGQAGYGHVSGVERAIRRQGGRTH